MIAFFLSPVGRWLGGTVLVLALLGGAYLWVYSDGYSDGKAEIQRRWDSAREAAALEAEQARSAAERAVDAAGDGRLSDDIYNRDRSAGEVRGVARDHLLGQSRH